MEAERGHVAAAHMRRAAHDSAYRDAIRSATPNGPDGYVTVPVASGDGTDWLFGQCDEAGTPVAVAAERAGELAVYRLERIL